MRAVDSCPIIVVASDADILMLLIYAVEKYKGNDPANIIQMKIDAESLSPIFFNFCMKLYKLPDIFLTFASMGLFLSCAHV